MPRQFRVVAGCPLKAASDKGYDDAWSVAPPNLPRRGKGGIFCAAQFCAGAGVVRLDLARQLAGVLGASYFKVEDLRAEDLVSIAKEHRV